MAKCKECEKDFTYGEYIEFNICDECENEIKYIGNIEYKQIYRCFECGREWCYD